MILGSSLSLAQVVVVVVVVVVVGEGGEEEEEGWEMGAWMGKEALRVAVWCCTLSPFPLLL